MIQVFLLLQQSYEKFGSLNKLSTWGKYVNLGLSNDIIYDYAEEGAEKISFSLQREGENPLSLDYSYVPGKDILEGSTTATETEIHLPWDMVEFLAADRIVPQTIYSTIREDDSLGVHGENAINFLEEYGDSYEVAPCFYNGTQNKSLLYYVNWWMDKLFNGFNLYSNRILEADAVSLRYKEKSRDLLGNAHRAVNVGFGITYVLPILIALLKAKKGDLIIIENPEAHLHPKAQRLMGELLVKAASTGAQIIIETHSDHILNGIRICAKKRYLDARQIKFFFFLREDVGSRFNVNVYTPILKQNGDIDIWPEGFFDEWDNALAELF
jgi:predicted ATPase